MTGAGAKRPAAAAAPSRALVIGNSYVGAMIKAAALAPDDAPLRRFDFAAAGQGSFRSIAVEDGRLVAVRTLRDDLLPLAEYPVVFLYGDLPHPIQLVLYERKLQKYAYSTQVEELALRNMITHSSSIAVRRTVADATAARIVMLPGNPVATAPRTSPDERARMLALVRHLVGGEVISSPAALLDDDGVPIQAFYKGSVRITGEAVPANEQAKHDLHHYNAEAGAVWLAALAELLDAA